MRHELAVDDARVGQRQRGDAVAAVDRVGEDFSAEVEVRHDTTFTRVLGEFVFLKKPRRMDSNHCLLQLGQTPGLGCGRATSTLLRDKKNRVASRRTRHTAHTTTTPPTRGASPLHLLPGYHRRLRMQRQRQIRRCDFRHRRTGSH